MSATPPASALDRIAAHLDAVEALLADPEGAMPVEPFDASGEPLTGDADDVRRAVDLLARANTLEVELTGLRDRIAGELAASRRRRPVTMSRAPRHLDTRM
ncbi:MAG: hypothetical protein ACE5GB_12190 [Acidimicrobiales bacterium]